MPEAVIVDAVRTPIGRAFKGSLAGLRPDDTGAFVIDQLLERNPDVCARVGRGADRRLRPAAGPPGLQHRAHHRAAVRAAAGLGQRCDGLALLRLEPRGDPPGRQRGPRRRGRHLHRRRGRVGQPLQRAPGGGRRRRPEREAAGQRTVSPTPTSRWASRPRTWPTSGRSAAPTWTSTRSAHRSSRSRRRSPGSSTARSCR